MREQTLGALPVGLARLTLSNNIQGCVRGTNKSERSNGESRVVRAKLPVSLVTQTTKLAPGASRL